MSFFKKLKDRLFKSSSKIEEGLDAIVEDGGVEEELDQQLADNAPDTAASDQADQARADAEAAEAAARAEAEAEAAERAAQAEAEAARRAQEAETARLKAEAEAARIAQEAEAARKKAEEEAAAARLEAEQETARIAQEAELARQKAEEAAEIARLKAKEEAERAAQEAAQKDAAAREAAAERAAQEAEEAARQQAAQDAARAQAEAEAARRAAEAEKQAQEAAARAEAEAAQRAAEEAARAQEARAQAEAAAAKADAARLAADEATRAEAARQEAARQEAADALTEDSPEADGPDAPKRGFFSRILGRSAPKVVKRRVLDDAMLESLEDLLITADLGVETAMQVSANMAAGRFGKKLSTDEIKALLADEVTQILEPVARPMPLYTKKPQVVLVVGVNGSGKTTTIGKLASQFKAAGKSVVIAAGDTFRAAAVEQLQVWGERAGVPVLTAPEGSDPASLAFDAMAKAEADGADLLMIDTAGRLQNRKDLMEELAKIVRVIRKKDPEAPHNTLLVLDATTGQNALSQVEIFTQIADVSGLVMTKLDGTAKGGVLVALAAKFGLPIHAIGVGEAIDDLAPFDPQDFAEALTGAGR